MIPKIVGEAYRKPIELTKRYAKEDYPVLFIGERGAGKECFGQLYMASSNRGGKKLTVNCAAIAFDLLRSEVFGHKKGAFTGANTERDGKLKICNNGILFLDELGDASQDFQAAILRVSEGNSFSPVGSDEEITDINTRVIAATNRPSSIRQDLKDRFRILPIPPLQRDDIPALAEHFLEKPLREEFLQDLMRREYSGNVRDLKTACEEIFAKHGSGIFSEHKSKPLNNNLSFDYERYCDEIETWGRYLQPTIDKYKFGFEYRYFPLSMSPASKEILYEILYGNFAGSPHDLALLGQEFLDKITEREIEQSPDFVPGLVKIVDFLEIGVKRVGRSNVELLPRFAQNLKKLFKSGDLPYLLDAIKTLKTGGVSLSIEVHQKTTVLLHLLDLEHTEAVKRFRLYYLEHYKGLYPTIEEAARASGIKTSTFRTALSKLKAQTKKKENT